MTKGFKCDTILKIFKNGKFYQRRLLSLQGPGRTPEIIVLQDYTADETMKGVVLMRYSAYSKMLVASLGNRPADLVLKNGKVTFMRVIPDSRLDDVTIMLK